MTLPDLGDDTRGRCRTYQHLIDGTVAVDPAAEHTVAWSSLWRRRQADLTLERLTRADFHQPLLWTIVEAAAAAPDTRDRDIDVPPNGPAHETRFFLASCLQRTEWVARETGISILFLAKVETGAVADGDTNGWYATRVRAAAAERDEVRQLLDGLADRGLAVTIGANRAA